MKKILAVFLSVLTIAAFAFTFAGCDDGEDQIEINQWDYFDEYINYILYEYLEERPSDWSRDRIVNSYGEVQPNCWSFVYNFGDVSVKNIFSHTDLDYYFRLYVDRLSAAKAITMTKLSLMVYAESDCEMQFSMAITGDDRPRAVTTVNAVANRATELLFENFAEYTWKTNSEARIIITLENPNSIGAVKYGFSNLEMMLKQNG